MEAPGWLLEARTSEAESQKVQWRARGATSSLRGGKPPEAFWCYFCKVLNIMCSVEAQMVVAGGCRGCCGSDSVNFGGGGGGLVKTAAPRAAVFRQRE